MRQEKVKSEVMLQLENLTKDFDGLEAVSSVNYSVNRGVLNGIIGSNGSGKTTLINLISGELPVTRGKILFNGKDITTLPAYERVKLGIGRIFQISEVFRNLTVIENVIAGLLRHQHDNHTGRFMFVPKEKHTEIWNRAEAILEYTLLAECRDSLACTIPHGSMRRLEIAIACSTEPDLFLLDEPFAGLTVEEMESMEHFIKGRIAKDHTVLIIEHRLEAMMRIAEIISVMDKGKLVFKGTPEEVQKSDLVKQAYLGALSL